MTQRKTGRVLAASLHQAIAELVPARLEFYEHWLRWNGTGQGGLGRAPLAAVLGFLRAEGDRYAPVVRRAGVWSVTWALDAWPAAARRVILKLPAPLRARVALGVGRRLVRRTWASSRARVRVHGRTADVELWGSIFCEVREPVAEPQCGFYAAAFAELLSRFALPATVQVHACRAVGAERCALAVAWGEDDPSVAERRGLEGGMT
jgi:bacteriochlorophyll 4-vinyl reductase